MQEVQSPPQEDFPLFLSFIMRQMTNPTRTANAAVSKMVTQFSAMNANIFLSSFFLFLLFYDFDVFFQLGGFLIRTYQHIDHERQQQHITVNDGNTALTQTGDGTYITVSNLDFYDAASSTPTTPVATDNY